MEQPASASHSNSKVSIPVSFRLSESTEQYMLERQVSAFLQKPISTEFPLMARRKLLAPDRMELQAQGLLGPEITDNDVILRVSDVYHLMMDQYKDKFIEYDRILRESRVVENGDKCGEYIEVGKKNNRIIPPERSIRAAATFNAELNLMRKRDRRTFFDVNTLTVHKVKRRSANRFAIPDFPAVLKPQISREDLAMTLGSVDSVEQVLGSCGVRSPSPVTVSEQEIALEIENSNKPTADPRCTVAPDCTVPVVPKKKNTVPVKDGCVFCHQKIQPSDRFVGCAKCGNYAHPNCMDMQDEMYKTVKTYNWMCIDCKPCSVCGKVDAEDKMLFCDKCDRGYHTFCVGLNSLPDGPWICFAYCRPPEKSVVVPRTYGAKDAARLNALNAAKTSSGAIRCEDCQSVMTKNELHKWKRRTIKDLVLCSQCNRRRRFGD